MDFMTMMERRYSCRSFQDKAVAREDLLKIVEAGRLTPSACNSQPWKFLVIDEEEAKEKLCDALVLDGGITGCPWREKVPAFLVLCECEAKIIKRAAEYYGSTQRFAPGDVGAAAMNMCYAAMELGLDTCILGMLDQKKMQAHFGVPEDADVRMAIAVGYAAAERPEEKKRKALEEVCGINRW